MGLFLGMNKLSIPVKVRNWIRGINFLIWLLFAWLFVRGFDRTVEDFAGWWVLRGVEETSIRTEETVGSLEKRKWGIVLGASIRSGHFRERVETAGELWKAGKVEKLLLSGDGRETYYDEPAAMKKVLLAAGVPEEALVLDRSGFSTFQSMERAAGEYGIEEAWVVTQEFHGPRVVYLARHHGIRAGVVVASHPGDSSYDEARERKARVKAVLEVWGLAETAMGLMEKASPSLEELAAM